MAERRESVRLELNDSGFSTGMVKAAAATSLLNKELSSLSRRSATSITRVDALTTSTNALRKEFDGFPSVDLSGGLDGVSRSARDTDNSINQLTGRLRLFADAAAVLGPALVPIGGVAVAGMAGLAAQMGVAAVAGGVLIGSMQGLGDALEALNDARLEPTSENLAKAEDALNALSPAAANFAREASGMLPVLQGIRDAGAEGLFPGLTESLDDLERLAPVVANVFGRIGEAVGDIAADGAESLASDRWTEFFDFIATEGPRSLSEMATAIGSVTHGLAELWMAFAPLNNSFSGWLMDVAAGFDSWASGLSETDGLREFFDYIRETGPQVADTFGSLVNLFVQLVQAAAPLGGPVLRALEGVADAAAAIADSGLGTVLLSAAAGMAAFSRASKGLQAVGGSKMFAPITADLRNMVGALDSTKRSTDRATTSVAAFAAADRQRLATLGKSAAAVAGLTVATTGMADGMGISNTASLALMGTLAGPWGAAAGASVGLLMDMKSAADDATTGFHGLDDAINSANIEELTQRIAEAKAEMADQDKVTGFRDFFSDAFRDIGASGSSSAMKAYTDEIDRAEKELVELKNARADAAADDSLYNSIQAESAALEKNIGLMRSKRDAALRGFSAETDYAQSLLDAKKALEDNGRAWGLNSEAGLKNRRVVEQQAASWNQLNREQGQTPAQARKARAALEDTAASLGATREQAKRYARQLLDIPNDLETKIGLDVDTAMQRARAIKAELASIDRNIDVYVNVRRPNAGGFGPQIVEANGGVLDFYADGGVAENHVAQIAPAGAWRVWAEPETGGEAYIPLAPAKRERSIDIWEQVGSRLGVQFERFAAGGISDDDEDSKDGKKKRRRKNYFDVTDNTKALQASIDRLTEKSADQTAATEAQRDALEQATEATEMWADRMADVAKGTTSGFNTGLFDRDSNVWAAGSGGGPISNLTKDIGGLEVRADLQAQLAGMGLSGDALAALLSEGDNADIQALIDSGQVGQYAELFNQRAALQGSVGAAAGQQAFGQEYAAARAYEEKQFGALQDQLATQKRTEARIGGLEAQIARTAAAVERLNNEGPAATGREVGRVINEGAASAHREGRWRNG